MIDLKQTMLKNWQEKNFPRSRYEAMTKDELIDMILIMQFTLGMAEEVGEICHHILKGAQGIRGGVNGIDKKQVADGFGDTIVFGEQLCSALDINAEEEVSEVIDAVLKRNWKEDPSGKKMKTPIQEYCTCLADGVFTTTSYDRKKDRYICDECKKMQSFVSLMGQYKEYCDCKQKGILTSSFHDREGKPICFNCYLPKKPYQPV